ncbi:MAG: sigma-54-dependent Fis family transcriptional regulator [Gammaproteobacteria bacterium]|nr:sigma-54-dependent Fis family transcriptional regulator [Gammaproteobacteria bacterium]NNJ90718.1 sigma-54-dependent Fis family transcriptional regulator [Gammaproteobacteria bacterium]
MQAPSPDPILIVDDNPTNLLVLTQTLEELNYPISMAHSGEEALELAQNQPPSLILLDIMMPGMDGYETLSALREDDSLVDIPVIFLSALDDLDYKIKGLSLGAVDYITKPFQIQEVLARVQTHLTISNLKKELAKRNRQLESTNEYILEAVAEGIYGLSPDGLITFANPAAGKLTGYSQKELLGKSVFEIHFFAQWDGSRYPAEKTPIFRTLNEHVLLSSEQDVMWRKSGDHFPIEYTCAPYLVDDEAKGAVLAFQDITQRKRQENTLRQALTEVEKLKEKLQAENTYLQNQIRNEGQFQDIVGQSTPLIHLLEQVKQVATTHSTVLILGESGTGKEAIARAIHDSSTRVSRPLIKINCGAISPNLIESELFGHEKGAFTGALKQRTGYFELADGGTIFLDEVGELPLEAQVKLLRVLQEQEVSRVGSEETLPVDVRVIAATNKNLSTMVKQGLFRTDLYYRLNVFPLQIPPLRERKEDIPLLANHFLQDQATTLGKELEGIAPESMQLLLDYQWPGNIRELQNVIERSAILSNGSKLVINDSLTSSDPSNKPGINSAESSQDSNALADESQYRLIDFEKQHILKVLEMTDWTIAGKAGAAEILDLPASTLRSKMKKLGIHRPK